MTQEREFNSAEYWRKRYQNEHHALIELQSRIEALEKDAARYRLASEQDNFCDFVIHAFGAYCDDKEGADKVIDTAMQSEKGGA